MMIINYNNFLESLDNDDVVELFEQLFKSKDLKFALEDSFGEPIQKRLAEHLEYRGIKKAKDEDKRKIWFNEGAKCRILKAGASGWKKGRVKINVTVEFIPDEPLKVESLLDEIRREIADSQT